MKHQEDKLSKANSPLFPIKMISKLEWTKSNSQQNMEQLQDSIIVERIAGKIFHLWIKAPNLACWFLI